MKVRKIFHFNVENPGEQIKNRLIFVLLGVFEILPYKRRNTVLWHLT